MKQVQKDDVSQQVFYLNRWVSKKHFRVYVHKADGSQRLVESYEEFQEALCSGIWFDSKESANPPVKIEEEVNHVIPDNAAFLILEKEIINEIPVTNELVEEKKEPEIVEEKPDMNASLGKVEPKFRVKDVKKPVELNQFKANRSGGKQL